VNAVPLPFVCAWCERIRTVPGEWKEAEPRDLSRAEATHGICPECLAKEARAAAAAEREHR
jgi:hypothetical protein